MTCLKQNTPKEKLQPQWSGIASDATGSYTNGQFDSDATYSYPAHMRKG